MPQPASDRVIALPDGRLQIHAPAKLNLGLRVHPVRPDGFHSLETWMVPISWHDTIFISPPPTPPAGPLTFSVSGRAEGIPLELEKNLVTRAALALARAAGISARGDIHLHKVLPPGGGLGGGSSDAANALVALNRLWELNWEEDRLIAIAAELGSDIPFFVPGRASLCTGRGEIMSDLPGKSGPVFGVLLIPPLGCPTKEVFAAFDRGEQHAAAVRETPTDWPRIASASADELLERLVNDLEPAAFFVAPWLRELRGRAEKIIGRRIHVTGSGSTLFTLCSSSAGADELQVTLERALGDAVACIPVKVLV